MACFREKNKPKRPDEKLDKQNRKSRRTPFFRLGISTLILAGALALTSCGDSFSKSSDSWKGREFDGYVATELYVGQITTEPPECSTVWCKTAETTVYFDGLVNPKNMVFLSLPDCTMLNVGCIPKHIWKNNKTYYKTKFAEIGCNLLNKNGKEIVFKNGDSPCASTTIQVENGTGTGKIKTFWGTYDIEISDYESDYFFRDAKAKMVLSITPPNFEQACQENDDVKRHMEVIEPSEEDVIEGKDVTNNPDECIWCKTHEVMGLYFKDEGGQQFTPQKVPLPDCKELIVEYAQKGMNQTTLVVTLVDTDGKELGNGEITILFGNISKNKNKIEIETLYGKYQITVSECEYKSASDFGNMYFYGIVDLSITPPKFSKECQI